MKKERRRADRSPSFFSAPAGLLFPAPRVTIHQATPAKVAEDGDDDVKTVERGLEGNVLVEVEHAGDYIHSNPNEPLFQILVSQCPDANEGQGGGESIGDGNGGVGEGGEQPPYQSPQQQENVAPEQGEVKRNVGDGRSALSRATLQGEGLPFPKAVSGHGQIVELHATVGIQSLLKVEHDTQKLHDCTHGPHPDGCTVFQQDVGEAKDGRCDVKPVVNLKVHVFISYRL